MRTGRSVALRCLMTCAALLLAQSADATLVTFKFDGQFGPSNLTGRNYTGEITYDTDMKTSQTLYGGGESVTTYGIGGVSNGGTIKATYVSDNFGTTGFFEAPVRLNYHVNTTCADGRPCSTLTILSDFTNTSQGATLYMEFFDVAGVGGPDLPNVFPANDKIFNSRLSYATTSGYGYVSPDGGGTISYHQSLAGGGVGAAPEPATWAMLIGGFAMIGAALRRRRSCAHQLSYR